MYTGQPMRFVGKYGNVYYKKYCDLHRTNGPAVEHNGYKAWYIDGKKHREDGPAVEYPNGDKEWWLNGELTRPDGKPAKEYANNNLHYNSQDLKKHNGELHAGQ